MSADIEKAREAFLNMIADAVRWEEECDGEEMYYHLTTRYVQLEELLKALGIEQGYAVSAGDAIEQALAIEPTSLPAPLMTGRTVE